MNKPRELVNKINKSCEDCGGSGYCKDICTEAGMKETYEDPCSTCNGLGYVLELEKGCEMLLVDDEHQDGEIFEITDIMQGQLGIYVDGSGWNLESNGDFEDIRCENHSFENLGKKLELGDLLLALSKKEIQTPMFVDNGKLAILEDDLKRTWLFIDLNLPPEEQSEETINSLIKILS
ncbi:MAG: hypothetical protein ACTSQE_12620 [Candidatus Heimdallarchaeaceae archaeon]